MIYTVNSFSFRVWKKEIICIVATQKNWGTYLTFLNVSSALCAVSPNDLNHIAHHNLKLQRLLTFISVLRITVLGFSCFEWYCCLHLWNSPFLLYYHETIKISAYSYSQTFLKYNSDSDYSDPITCISDFCYFAIWNKHFREYFCTPVSSFT